MIEKLTYSGADGVAASTGNTGATAVSATGGTIVHAPAQAVSESPRSLRVVGTTTSGQLFISKTVTATDAIAVDVPLRISQFPAVSAYPGMIFLGTGTTRCVQIALTNAGKFRIYDSANTNIHESTGSFALNTDVIVSLYMTRAASTGTIRVVVYSSDRSTILADSGTLTGRATGAASVDTVRVGLKSSTSSAEPAGWIGEPRWEVGASALLPAPVAPPADPAIAFMWNATLGAYEAGDVFTWDGTAYIRLDEVSA